jgi:LuxR family maltose regulon positive regulatory protein
VHDLLRQGLPNKEIAARLGVSPHTVRTHLKRLYRDQGVRTRSAAVAIWLRRRAG